MPEHELISLLGEPDSTRTIISGWDKEERQYDCWTYCSQLDWDGMRNRWNDQPEFTYWLSRIDPSKDEEYDAVLRLYLRHGKLAGIENAEDLGDFSSSRMRF